MANTQITIIALVNAAIGVKNDDHVPHAIEALDNNLSSGGEFKTKAL